MSLLRAEASSSLPVPNAVDASLPDWLLSAESDAPLLQSTGCCVQADADGFYTCEQSPVSWFALQVTPVFRESIERAPSSVVVCVEDATVKVDDEAGSGSVSGFFRETAAAVQIRGRNVLSWHETASGWDLKGTLELTLTVPLPKGPGLRVIESVGTRIVRKTCETRLEPYLADLRTAYLAYARST